MDSVSYGLDYRIARKLGTFLTHIFEIVTFSRMLTCWACDNDVKPRDVVGIRRTRGQMCLICFHARKHTARIRGPKYGRQCVNCGGSRQQWDEMPLHGFDDNLKQSYWMCHYCQDNHPYWKPGKSIQI